jgi:GPN-loop GTPase
MDVDSEPSAESKPTQMDLEDQASRRRRRRTYSLGDFSFFFGVLNAIFRAQADAKGKGKADAAEEEKGKGKGKGDELADSIGSLSIGPGRANFKKKPVIILVIGMAGASISFALFNCHFSRTDGRPNR